MRGNALSELGRLDEAATAYRMAIQLREWYPKALANLGNVLLRQNKPEEAIPQYKSALRSGFSTDASFVASLGLGEAYRQLGNIDQAIIHYRFAVAQHPGSAKAHLNLGAALDIKGQTSAAIKSLRKAIQLQPTLAAAHYDLGNSLGKQGQMAEAADAFREAARLQPDYAERTATSGTLSSNWAGIKKLWPNTAKGMRSGPGNRVGTTHPPNGSRIARRSSPANTASLRRGKRGRRPGR